MNLIPFPKIIPEVESKEAYKLESFIAQNCKRETDIISNIVFYPFGYPYIINAASVQLTPEAGV